MAILLTIKFCQILAFFIQIHIYPGCSEQTGADTLSSYTPSYGRLSNEYSVDLHAMPTYIGGCSSLYCLPISY